MFIPKQIEKQLGKDEIIEKEFKLRKRFSLQHYRIYVSNFQFFIVKNNGVTNIPYKSISSINLKNRRRGYLIILGVLHSLAGALLFWIKGEGYSLLMIPAGLLIMYFGYSQVQHIELGISGRPKSLKIKGQVEKLDSLLDLIMRRRESNDSGKI
jgi:hypothetical protein